MVPPTVPSLSNWKWRRERWVSEFFQTMSPERIPPSSSICLPMALSFILPFLLQSRILLRTCGPQIEQKTVYASSGMSRYGRTESSEHTGYVSPGLQRHFHAKPFFRKDGSCGRLDENPQRMKELLAEAGLEEGPWWMADTTEGGRRVPTMIS